jgi:hypothetical protein
VEGGVVRGLPYDLANHELVPDGGLTVDNRVPSPGDLQWTGSQMDPEHLQKC